MTRLGRAAIGLALVAAAVLTPTAAQATGNGIWYRAGSWPTVEPCVAAKYEVQGGGNLVQPATGTCFHDSYGYYFKILNEF